MTKITQAELLMAPNAEAMGNTPRHVVAPKAKAHGMKGMMAEMRAIAEAVPVSEATLAHWYTEQLAWQEGYQDRLGKALLAAGNDDRLKERASPLWPRFWTLNTRYVYATEVLSRLKGCGHILVCIQHGAQGAVIPEGWWQGLALRGLLADGDAGKTMDWDQACEVCSPLANMAQGLHRRHTSTT